MQKFDANGVHLLTLGVTDPQSNGPVCSADPGGFCTPTGVAVDSANNLYVADQGNNRIEKFSSAGAFISQWGTAGAGNGEFNGPTGVAVDASRPRVRQRDQQHAHPALQLASVPRPVGL